jgi:subtilisin-like proprotein convertase family protein
MNFRIVLRDNNDGAGCTAEDNVVLTVTGSAGPFIVTEPNTNVLWYVGETKTVTWDVSNTNIAPVNCANVRIRLSTDGGFTYPVTLAASVPNTGSANISVPNNLSATCRIKVEAVGNIFFDISNQNFRIQLPPVPTFSLSTSASTLPACAGDTVSFAVNVTPILNFSDPVQLTVSGAPAGAVVQVNPNPATPGGSAAVTVTGLTPAMAGNYTLTVQGTSGTIVQTTTVQLNLLPGAPASPSAISPLVGVSGQPLNATLTWNTVPFTENYIVEVATNPSFAAGTIIQLSVLNSVSIQTVTLQAGTVYYWRIKTVNDCGESIYSSVYAFQTGNLACNQVFNSTDVPKTIDANSVNTAVSTLNVPLNKSIADVDLTLLANHAYVGDLDAKLVSPLNDTILLFDRPGVPASTFGCASNNLNLVFDDNAAQTAAALEVMCNSVFPALLGQFQPIGLLSDLNGQSAQGDWKILVTDNSADDGGSITGWGLTFCFSDIIPSGTLATNSPLTVPQAGNGIVSNTHLALALSGTTAQSQFTLLNLPQHGTLTLNGTPLGLGGTFTQADINASLLVYTHNNDNATADQFQFDAVDLNNFAWVHNATFNIVIIQNNLAATAAQTQAVSCNNGANGQITVTASGLNGQYQYSLNGGPNQTSNVFGNLTAGNYTVVVTGQFGFTVTTNPVTLANPPAISVSTNVVDDDVTVTASGGTGTLQYSLDGINYQASNVFQNLANGIYTITARDANGCTATAEAIVAVNTLIANLAVQTPISCFGGSNGAVMATVGGGQMPFEYSLNGGAFQSGNTFSGLAAGTYTVVAKDNQGFTATTNTVALTNPPAINASANAVLNVVTVTASGGTGVLEYSINGTNFQTSNTFSNLANGDYTVTVRDANGCTATTQVTVNVPSLALISVVQTHEILCFGDHTGALEVTATGGIPPYDYSLNDGAYQSSNTFTGLGSGTYTVKVRDSAGTVITSSSVFLPEPPQLVASVTVTGNDADFSATGGTPPYQFSCNCPLPPTNLPNGNYSVTVTDANGCMNTEDFSINLPPLTATAQVIDADLCDETATLEVAAFGGELPYEYSLNGGPFQSGNTFTVSAGLNEVRVRDAAGTIFLLNVNVPIPTLVSLSATAANDSIVASAQFGTPPYLYSIDGTNFQNSNIFPDLPNGIYTVTVMDDNGCTATTSVTVNVVGTVEPGVAWGLIVSPNPSTGLFQLTMQHAPATLRAEVFDAAGRNLRTLDFTPAAGGLFSTRLDLQDFPQGTYLLRLTDGKDWGAVRLSLIR